MSRISPWERVWRTFIASVTKRDQAIRRYVGEDLAGNKFYELERAASSSSNVNRGYDPAPSQELPGVEWQQWLKNARRFPPSEEEMRRNQIYLKHTQQAQLIRDAATEKRAPQVASQGKGAADLDRKHNFPTYEDIEIAPGAERRKD